MLRELIPSSDTVIWYRHLIPSRVVTVSRWIVRRARCYTVKHTVDSAQLFSVPIRPR